MPEDENPIYYPEAGAQRSGPEAQSQSNDGRGGRGRSNESSSGGGGGRNGANPSRSSSGRFTGNTESESESPQPQESKEQPMGHSNQPLVVAGGPGFGYPLTPFGYPGYGYGAYPAAPGAGSNIVVAGQGDNGHHSQLETLSDIALGSLRESAAAGRTNQISTQIEGLGDRLDTQAGFSRELNVMREFTSAQKDRGDLENRLLTAIKDESIRTREMFTEQRLREQETRIADLRDARRDDRLLEVLHDIRRAVTPRA